MTATGRDPLPMVFLHGWLSGGSDWSPVASAIRDIRSSCPELLPHENWDAGIRQLAESLPPCVLAGYSMGGRIALAAALAPHSPVRGLVVVSANPGIEDNLEREQRRASDAKLLDGLTDATRDPFFNAWFRQPLFQSVDASQRQRWIDERRELDLARQRELLRCYGIASQPNFWPKLHTLSIPTLLITGELDSKYRDILQTMSTRLPDCESVILPGVSHAPHREQPALVRSRIESWYDRRMRRLTPAPSAPPIASGAAREA
jgi:2-succinyl-6-hydroxy-2,4-cyclohexadiene-1-carboxylate synthase